MAYSNEVIYREIILDHIKNPRNKSKHHENYNEYTLKNPACGDIVTVYAKIDNNKIIDLTYDVEGCSICTASTSIMSEILIGKNKDEVKNFVLNFNKMMVGDNYNEEVLQEAICFKGIINIPARIKCATLGYKALMEILEEKVGEFSEKR